MECQCRQAVALGEPRCPHCRTADFADAGASLCWRAGLWDLWSASRAPDASQREEDYISQDARGEGVRGRNCPSSCGRRGFLAPRSRLVTRPRGSRKQCCGPASGAPAGGRACLPRRPSDEAYPRVREAGREGRQRISLAGAGFRTRRQRRLAAEIEIVGFGSKDGDGKAYSGCLSNQNCHRINSAACCETNTRPPRPANLVSELGNQCLDMQISHFKGGVTPPRASPGGRSPQVQ
ncbi:uncharacterized protein [Castor canadensis]|uniref:Uncharacterized protein n=1 Tax=Castor canadensis TaxID=51338 RepID=A0AC58KK47_CASCN